MFFSVKWIVVVAVSVLLHESAHMGMCRLLGIPVFGMKGLPWGVTAFAPLMYEPHSQFLVSVAGPMFNFFLLIFSSFVSKVFGDETAELFILANISNGILNLIPALPLDGGIMAKAFLCSKFGFVRGFVYMIRITLGVGIILMLFGIEMFIATGYNISYFVAGIFIVGNLRHEKDLVMCIKKRVLTGEISSSSAIKNLYVSSDSNAICLVDLISPSYTLVFTAVKNKEKIGKVSQKRLLECVMENSMATLEECIEKN